MDLSHNQWIILQEAEDMSLDRGCISDGYHTFNELYDHRVALYIALCEKIWLTGLNASAPRVWRSKFHSDGSKFDGWFILGIGIGPGEQITYHLPDSKWEACGFAERLERSPDYDGHTSADVLNRLGKL